MGNGCIDPGYLHLGTSWRLVVSFTVLPLYPWGKSPRNLSGRYGEDKIFHPTGARTPTIIRPRHSQSLYRLRYRGKCLINWNRPRPLPSKFFAINYSSVILPFDDVKSTDTDSFLMS
jgi:hypothetical protein